MRECAIIKLYKIRKPVKSKYFFYYDRYVDGLSMSCAGYSIARGFIKSLALIAADKNIFPIALWTDRQSKFYTTNFLIQYIKHSYLHSMFNLIKYICNKEQFLWKWCLYHHFVNKFWFKVSYCLYKFKDKLS